jgi:hypothetical protein
LLSYTVTLKEKTCKEGKETKPGTLKLKNYKSLTETDSLQELALKLKNKTVSHILEALKLKVMKENSFTCHTDGETY